MTITRQLVAVDHAVKLLRSLTTLNSSSTHDIIVPTGDRPSAKEVEVLGKLINLAYEMDIIMKELYAS